MKHNKQSDETKHIFRKAERGIPGVYTGLSYKISKLILPALIVTAFLGLSFFSVSNILYASGALKVDRITVFCTSGAYGYITDDELHSDFAKMAGVLSDSDSFCQKISVNKCSTAQMEAIAAKYGIFGESIDYILINEKNQVIDYITRVQDLHELLISLAEHGYLEVEYEQ